MSERHPISESGSRGQAQRRDWRDLSKLFEKLPPHAIEAEMCLLGSMLLDPRVIGDVILIVRSGDDLYKPANGAIYDAMVTLYDEHASLDIVQLNQAMADRGLLETIGGVEYLVELAGSVPSAANATHYARLVREKAMVRHLISAAGDILYQAYHSADDAQTILDEAEQRIFHIANQAEQTQAESLHDLLKQTMAMIEANEGKAITGVPSGFADLDELMHGFQKGEMIIIAARPSMGKSALALNVAEQMAVRGHGVGLFSLEMSRQQLVQRLLASRSGVDSQRIRRSMLNTDEYHKLHFACDELIKAPIYIDDTPGLSILQARAKARRLVEKHQVEAIFIDYLQLMAAGGRVESRQVEISEISRGVKAMARELSIPVVCLSQLNRTPEQREGHRPRMSDLRESGSLEQDADVVMMLHREEYYHQGDDDWAEENPEKQGLAELILTKQRNGPTGTVKLSWISRSTRFRDYAPTRASDAYYEGKPGPAQAVAGVGAGAAPAASSMASPRRRGGSSRDADDPSDLPI